MVVICAYLCMCINMMHALTIENTKQSEEKMHIMLAIVPGNNDRVYEIAHELQEMLECKQCAKSGFLITQKKLEQDVEALLLQQLEKDRFPLIVTLQVQNDIVRWRLYDVIARKGVAAKAGQLGFYNARTYAEYIADELWPLLTGQEGFFTTRIAFCKDSKKGKAPREKFLCITTPYAHAQNASNYENQILNPGFIFAPRWNKDSNNPLILYSQSTSANVRLLSTTLDGKRKIVANNDGMTMLPSFSSDGKTVVYCATSGGKTALYLCEFNPLERRTFLRVLHDTAANNTSPTLCDNGDVVFCSDMTGKNPRICYYHADARQVEYLTKDGYCVSPAYCPKTRKIAYSRLVNSYMQIFIYDVMTHNDYQVTFDKTDKDECSWSPCGNYLVFAQENNNSSRIALLNMITNEKVFLTSTADYCTYPSWSGKYAVPLALQS